MNVFVKDVDLIVLSDWNNNVPKRNEFPIKLFHYKNTHLHVKYIDMNIHVKDTFVCCTSTET